MKKPYSSGFTLIEIAIVLLVVAIILGYTLAMLPIQQELKQYRQADKEMDEIIDSLYAFAQVNGYLPCPAWFVPNPAITSNGFECRDGDGVVANCDAVTPNPAVNSCDVWFGFVPGKTLGINGRYSATSGLLLDPWGEAYQYQVTNVNANGAGSLGEDFVIQGDMQVEGIANLTPNLTICNTHVGSTNTNCSGANTRIINVAPVVILSVGKDRGTIASAIQNENLDNSAADRVFVKSTHSTAANAEYDDIVKWLSLNKLISKMIEADQLP